MARCGWAAAAVACLAAQAMPALAGPPDPAWVTSFVEEDDFWAPHNKDRHYTHGVRVAFTSPDVHSPFWQAPFDWIGSVTTAFPSKDPSLGSAAEPIDRFDALQLNLGIVGPGSLANAMQTHYHLLIQVAPFQGWHAQLHNEPAADLYYERKWRHHGESEGGWGWDAIPQAGARVGNVYDYLAAGGLLRVGRNLRVDYGPPHIDLNTGAEYLNLERLTAGDWGIYFFVGGEARAVAHNIFLDGNDFKSSAHVQKIPAVGDAEMGAAFFWWHLRLAYTLIYRSPEFIHQTGPDHYGSLNLTLHLSF